MTLDTIGRCSRTRSRIALLGERTTLRSVSGVDPGPEASVRKLLGAEHEQRVQELGLVLLGAAGATTEDDAAIGAVGSCRRAASPSPAAPRRYSATSSARGCSGCRKIRAGS